VRKASELPKLPTVSWINDPKGMVATGQCFRQLLKKKCLVEVDVYRRGVLESITNRERRGRSTGRDVPEGVVSGRNIMSRKLSRGGAMVGMAVLSVAYAGTSDAHAAQIADGGTAAPDYGSVSMPPGFPVSPLPPPTSTVTNTEQGESEIFTVVPPGSPGSDASADVPAAARSELNISIPLDQLDTAKISQIDKDLSAVLPPAATQVPDPAVRPLNDYGYGVTIGCAENGHYYKWSDGDGTLHLAQQCSKAVVNWGYQISPGLGSLIVSSVDEMGMAWYKNHKKQPSNAPHPNEPWDYFFHGTFNPVGDNGVLLNYGDIFDFTIDIDGIAGPADLVVNGQVTTANF